MQEELCIVRSLYYPVRTDQYARIGHRIIAVENQILVFGGLSPNGDYNSSIIKIDCETMTLDLVHTKNSLRLQNFSLFSYEGSIYFWGGAGPSKEDARGSFCQNKLLKFEGNQFLVVQQKGRLPAPREYHASCMVSNKNLIIMGGSNGKSFFNDWYILECSSMTWTQVILNRSIPPFLDAQIFWYGGRGFLLTGQIYDKDQDELLTENKLFEFRFSDFRERRLDIQPMNISTDCKQKLPRGTPSAVFVPLESPYLMLMGGSYPSQRSSMTISNDVECFNLQTLEWFSISSAIKTAFAFEALYSNEKIYLVGGLTVSREIAQFVEYMELKIDYLEAKVCKVCRQVYGLKQFNIGDRNVLSIKVEADSSPRSFFSSQIIGRMALYIGYPFSALGLLIDNSLNLSGTNIDIEFGLISEMQEERNKSNVFKEASQPYNYISIIDNSYGFTQHEILECLNSFSLKTEKYTSDKRYEDEIEIRKEYGINLKLGTLRLGQSCLFITKTDDRSNLYAYFSVSSYYSSTPFSVVTYLISPEGQCSSQINRQLIRENVKHKIPENYEDVSAPTIIYIFDLKRLELSLKTDEKGRKNIFYKESLSKVYRDLQEYIQSLYLKPYKGRRMAVNGRQMKFRSYLEIFKKDEQNGDLSFISEQEYPKELFSCFHLYRVNVDDYFLRNILCYHKNRLIFTVSGIDSMFCGVVELAETVKVDICKTKIENRSDQLLFHRIIRSLLNKYQTKRVSKAGVKSLLTTSKDRSFGRDEPLRGKDENLSRPSVHQR